MKLIVSKDKHHLAQMAAAFLIRELKENSKLRLGLCAGSTPKQTYSELVQQVLVEKMSLKSLHCFYLDEYAGISPDDPRSFTAYIREYVINPLKLQPSQWTCWQRNAVDRLQACKDYERAIQELGGIDCQILGLGMNGHIGFNEPGSLKESHCRLVVLNEETLQNNAEALKGNGALPTHAFTLGIANILEARHILLLVSGGAKEKSFSRFLTESPSPSFPATFLKEHPNLTVIVDEAAFKARNEKRVSSSL